MRRASIAIAASLLFAAPTARAQGETPAEVQVAPSQIHLDSDVNAPRASTLPEAPPEAPPPPPHKKGFVLEGSMGALGFLGQFRHVAPPALLMHVQLGYEPTKWLMIFGEGETAFTDTSEIADESQTRAVPIYGFGGGARFTLHATDRVAFFGQASLGAMKAVVAKNALGILGFVNAESLGVALGGRIGVEWYQLDRHMALGVGLELRDASGFAKTIGKSDTGMMADATAAIRYTF